MIQFFVVSAAHPLKCLRQVTGLFSDRNHVNEERRKFADSLEPARKCSTLADHLDHLFHLAAKMQIPDRAGHQPETVQKRDAVGDQIRHRLRELGIKTPPQNRTEQRQSAVERDATIAGPLLSELIEESRRPLQRCCR